MQNNNQKQAGHSKSGLEGAMKGLFTAAACVSIVAVFIICIFMFANGFPAIMEIGPIEFLTGTEWRPNNDVYGILPMIIGSVLTTIGALIIGAPIGILSAVFLVFYCPKKIYPVLKSGVQGFHLLSMVSLG